MSTSGKQIMEGERTAPLVKLNRWLAEQNIEVMGLTPNCLEEDVQRIIEKLCQEMPNELRRTAMRNGPT